MTDANDEALLRRLVVALSAVPGVEAIALGGSRARGTAVATSDYDIGLYYCASRPVDVAALGKVAAALDDRGAEASVTSIGGWGPWIDGGGWLVVDGVHVDLLYRGALAAPQRRTTPYPAALAKALRERFEGEAGFALANARKSLDRGDVSYLAGCAFRAIACLCQTLFALNGVYLLNEKGAVAVVDGLALSPPAFAKRVASLFADLGSGNHAAGLDRLQELIVETRGLSSRR
jgi:predicted nucleotidyltransferase